MKSLKVHCILLITILLWASAFIGIKFGLAGYSPGSLALLRFLVASLCMGIMYCNLKQKQSIPLKDKLYLLFGGITGIGIYNICLNFGEITVSAGIASFVIGLMPVITVLLSVFFLKERLNSGVWTGIIISCVGLMILTMGEQSDINMQMGIVLIFISAVVGSILTIIQKKYSSKYHPTLIMSWIMWGGTLLLLMFLPDLWREMKQADVHATAAAVYMGVFPAALAYLAWTYVLQHLSASKASMSLNAMPIASTLLGFIFLEEMPSMISMTGGSIALIGALIAHRFQDHNAKDSELDNDAVAAQ